MACGRWQGGRGGYVVATSWPQGAGCCLSPCCVQWWGAQLPPPTPVHWCGTHLCRAMHKAAAATCGRRAAMLTPGCCEHPSASHPHGLHESPLSPPCPLPSPGPSNFFASSTALMSPKSSLTPSSLSSPLCRYSAVATKLIFAYGAAAHFACGCLASMLNSHCRPGVHRGRE